MVNGFENVHDYLLRLSGCTLYDPYSHLVYAARAADVRHVMVDGRWLLTDRRFTSLDWPALTATARTISRDLAAFCARLRPPS